VQEQIYFPALKLLNLNNPMKKLKKTYEKVRLLLIEKPEYRDNDELLVVRFWWDDMKRHGLNPKETSAFVFMTMMKDNLITAADEITRARRKVQEIHIELRGEKYHKRKLKQSEVKQQIKNL
jgi:hypothetical protein